MNQRIACSLVAVFLTAGFSRSGEASPVVLNGSFEDPLVTVNSFSNFNSGSNAITGWTVMGPAGSHVSIVSGTFLAPAFPAEDGAQWLDLTGNGSNQLEGVQQTLATTAGTSVRAVLLGRQHHRSPGLRHFQHRRTGYQRSVRRSVHERRRRRNADMATFFPHFRGDGRLDDDRIPQSRQWIR